MLLNLVLRVRKTTDGEEQSLTWVQWYNTDAMSMFVQ